MRILIAEDEVAIARALKVMLEKNKYAVDMVHNGNDALDYIQATSYDALVLDIMMPGKDGIEVLKAARAEGNTTPALFLTAKAEVADRVAGLDAGADDYLPKPFAASEFLARVRALTRRSSAYAPTELSFGNVTLDRGQYADGGYHLMGCMLSAASCNKWLCEEILKTSDFAGEQADITDEKLGENHVYFLPYLMGERSPINDTNARGTFTGMTMDTSRSDMVQAVLEGVAFAIRDSFEVAKSLGIEIPRSNICGGGAKSPLWRKIFANVLGIPLDMVKTEQGPGYGAAMLAMVGCGKFQTVQEAADALVETASTTEPDAALTAKYEARYQSFKKLYPALKSFFAATV